MAAQAPLEPDAIFSADGARVQTRRLHGAGARGRGPAQLSAALVALASAPVAIPVVAAGAACLAGLAGAATGVGVARRLLRPLAPLAAQCVQPGPGPGAGAATLHMTWTQIEVHWTFDR